MQPPPDSSLPLPLVVSPQNHGLLHASRLAAFASSSLALRCLLLPINPELPFKHHLNSLSIKLVASTPRSPWVNHLLRFRLSLQLPSHHRLDRDGNGDPCSPGAEARPGQALLAWYVYEVINYSYNVLRLCVNWIPWHLLTEYISTDAYIRACFVNLQRQTLQGLRRLPLRPSPPPFQP
jgi:hypothetical protein